MATSTSSSVGPHITSEVVSNGACGIEKIRTTSRVSPTAEQEPRPPSPVEEATDALMELDEPSVNTTSTSGVHYHSYTTSAGGGHRRGDQPVNLVDKDSFDQADYPAQLKVSAFTEVPHIHSKQRQNSNPLPDTDSNMNTTIGTLSNSGHHTPVTVHVNTPNTNSSHIKNRGSRDVNTSSLTLDFDALNLPLTSTPVGQQTGGASVDSGPDTAPSTSKGARNKLEESTGSQNEGNSSSQSVALLQSSESTGEELEAPIVGYEVMEQRARFTVFKIHVCKSQLERWFIFRRYTDFLVLNDKLGEMFPYFRLTLPPKRYFGDNFNDNFLKERVTRLQAFINNIVGHRDVSQSRPVRDFFCLDDPPGPHDSLEESRALCEALEEQIYGLKQELKDRDAKIGLLEAEVNIQKLEIDNLRKSLRIERALNSKRRNSPASQSDNSIIEQDESSCTEADQAQVIDEVKGQTSTSEAKTDHETHIRDDIDHKLQKEVQRIEDRICSLVEKETAPLLLAEAEEGATAW